MISIIIISKQNHPSPWMPYDFEIQPAAGPLREFCENHKSTIGAQEIWMQHIILESMRVSLYLHGKVRLVYCGCCEHAPCAHNIRKWLLDKGPLEVEVFVDRRAFDHVPMVPGLEKRTRDILDRGIVVLESCPFSESL